MTIYFEILIGLVAGLALGGLYFAGLWWTVSGVVDSPRPTLRVVASFVVRGALIVGSFAGLLVWSPTALVAAMAGFLGVRTIAARRASRAGRNGGAGPWS